MMVMRRNGPGPNGTTLIGYCQDGLTYRMSTTFPVGYGADRVIFSTGLVRREDGNWETVVEIRGNEDPTRLPGWRPA